MGEPVTTALIVSTIVTAASAGLSFKQAEDAKSAASDQRTRNEQLRVEQKEEAEQQQVEFDRDTENQRIRAEGVRTRNQQTGSNRARSAGRAGTILTSPLGVIDETPTTGKTLLGA